MGLKMRLQIRRRRVIPTALHDQILIFGVGQLLQEPSLTSSTVYSAKLFCMLTRVIIASNRCLYHALKQLLAFVTFKWNNPQELNHINASPHEHDEVFDYLPLVHLDLLLHLLVKVYTKIDLVQNIMVLNTHFISLSRDAILIQKLGLLFKISLTLKLCLIDYNKG